MSEHTVEPIRIALVQMRSGLDIDDNIAFAESHIREAAANGATYVQTPENTNYLDYKRARQFEQLKSQEETVAVGHFAALAKELGIWLHIGGMGIRLSDTRLANRAFFFRPDGSLATTYDKIHMFDVDLPSGERYRESSAYEAGSCAPLVQTPWGAVGMTICYDLRFPSLYRDLAQQGATLLTCPAAFTKQTGEAHWRTLLTARAIENGAFVAAAAQCGTHESGRETYGHSLIVDPWGKVVAEGDDKPGLIEAEINPGRVDDVRGRIPSLTHDKAITVNRVA